MFKILNGNFVLIQVLLAMHTVWAWDVVRFLSQIKNYWLYTPTGSGMWCEFESFLSVTVLLAILTDQQWDMVRGYISTQYIYY